VGAFFIRRTVQSIVLLIIVSIVGFSILNLAPGGPMAAYSVNPTLTHEERERIAEQMGLNDPIPVQYWRWATGLVQGDWGTSFRDSQAVTQILSNRLPATIELMVTSTVIAVTIGTVVGVLGAMRKNSLFDYLSTFGAMVALSIPTFWFGLMVIYLFSEELGWLPSGGRSTIGGNGSLWDQARHLVAPALVLALVTVAIWSRYARSSLIDALNQDYIQTARAKGLHERSVVIRHGIRNAVMPMVTLAGLQLPALFGGALVTETVFSWPGMGRLFVDSLEYRDYPVMMGILMLTAIMVIIGSFVADLMYALVDPRIRLS
jgi:peptide/nickel transport system permease protein